MLQRSKRNNNQSVQRLTFWQHFNIKYAFALALVLLSIIQPNTASAQIKTLQQIMAGIYKAYDSMPYLTFDVKYIYGTDTVNGDFTHDVLAGTYTMAGKKAKYNLGDIEFVQNDSFFLSIYNKEKFIIVADPPNKNAGTGLPMRAQIDSLVKNYSTFYTITTSKTAETAEAEETGKINFAKADEAAQFENFTITYYADRNFLQKVEYNFKEMVQADETAAPQLRNKTLSIEFANYRFDNFAEDMYDENKYIFFEEGMCKPVKKYTDYRIFYSRAAAIDKR
jgi:hypothetical protein